MTDPDWTSPDGLKAIKESVAATIPGWRAPIVYAVGLSSASSSPEPDFPHVNRPGGGHQLPAVVLAKVVGHDGSTATLELTSAQLEATVESLSPAEACTVVDHPNLAAWRQILGELRSNPARTAYAVFIEDLDDPVTSKADGALRARL